MKRVVIIGAGVGGLTVGALLAQAGYKVTVLEGQTYPGGSASTFTHKGYRFESGATIAGGFQPNGPHALIGEKLNIRWNVRQHDPAWVVHLPNYTIPLTQDNNAVLEAFPASKAFWNEQSRIANLAWKLSAQGLPFPPKDIAELIQLTKVGIKNLPHDLQMIPFAFASVNQWAKWHGMAENKAFIRFLDSTLLISAQTTSQHVNALYGATAMDLSRQGVYHVEGGIGGIAETLVSKIRELAGEVHYRHHVTRISFQHKQANGVYVKESRRATKESFIPADFVVANTTPWSLDTLLAESSPNQLKNEISRRTETQGAFVLHLGVESAKLPPNLPDHHQMVASLEGTMGEGHTVFVSFSPTWDTSRAPEGYRAVTVSTHTRVNQWWEWLQKDESHYYAQKQAYTERILDLIEKHITGFKSALALTLAGTPVTYEFYTARHRGMVGGFPQTSLFKSRSPRTGIQNIRLVGDSIFPGQSTAGVTLGAMRVADDIQRNLPLPVHSQNYRPNLKGTQA